MGRLLKLFTGGGDRPSTLHRLRPELVAQLKSKPGDLQTQELVFEFFGDDTRAMMACFRELSEENPLHLTGLARGLVRDGKHAMAVVQYQKLLKQNPDADVYTELALVYDALGKSDKASECRQKAQNP